MHPDEKLWPEPEGQGEEIKNRQASSLPCPALSECSHAAWLLKWPWPWGHQPWVSGSDMDFL